MAIRCMINFISRAPISPVGRGPQTSATTKVSDGKDPGLGKKTSMNKKKTTTQEHENIGGSVLFWLLLGINSSWKWSEYSFVFFLVIFSPNTVSPNTVSPAFVQAEIFSFTPWSRATILSVNVCMRFAFGQKILLISFIAFSFYTRRLTRSMEIVRRVNPQPCVCVFCFLRSFILARHTFNFIFPLKKIIFVCTLFRRC